MEPMQSEATSKMQQNDHDTLIRVESKVDTLVTELKRIADTQSATLALHETRLLAVEQAQHDFKVIWRFVVGVASVIGAAAAILVEALFGVHR